MSDSPAPTLLSPVPAEPAPTSAPVDTLDADPAQEAAQEPVLSSSTAVGVPPGFVPQPPVGGSPFVPSGVLPLPPGWTEHQAMGGALYWYHAASGQSTYQRPLSIPFPPPNFSVPPPGYPAFPPSSSSASAPASDVKEKKKKKEKAKDKVPIEGTSWVRVKTSEGNTFYMNKASKESVWTVPDEIKSEVAALEANEQAAEDARIAEEAASAKAELERLRAEVAEAKAAQAAAAAAASRKRKEAPVPTAPAAMKAAQRLKIESRPPPAAAAPQSRKKEPEEDDDVDLDALSALHNPSSPTHGGAAATAEEDDAEEADGNLGPAGPEEEEAWQRQIAAEMGIEYVSPEDREAQEKRDKAEEKRKEAEEKARVREEAGRSVFGQAPVGGRVEITLEEGKALFKSLLYEKNISPVAPWDFSLPLFINDPRYILLSAISDRQEVFEEYCRDKARELRQAKQQAAAASNGGASGSTTSSRTPSPEEAYRALLRQEVKSTRMRFDDFRKAWKKDRRFFGFGRDDREREKAFKAWLRELGEGKRAAAKKAEDDFLALLKEAPGINGDSRWRDVKITLEKDPRYDAVGSSSQREELFQGFAARNLSTTASLSKGAASNELAEDSATRKAREKKERAAASLREREEQIRAQQRKVGLDVQRSRGLVGREEAEREFGTLLVDKVHEHDAPWEVCLPLLERDPRYRSQALSLSDKHQLFGAHLAHLTRKRLAALHAAFAANTSSLATRFTDVHSKVADDAAVRRMHLGADALEDEYERWQRQQNDDARRAFSELLKENAFFTFWASQKKAEKRERAKGFGMEDADDDSGDEGDEGGGKASLKDMASQIDMKEVESVLRDRRYQVWDHVPEDREIWIREHMETISAPGLSVHVNL